MLRLFVGVVLVGGARWEFLVQFDRRDVSIYVLREGWPYFPLVEPRPGPIPVAYGRFVIVRRRVLALAIHRRHRHRAGAQAGGVALIEVNEIEGGTQEEVVDGGGVAGGGGAVLCVGGGGRGGGAGVGGG